MAKSESNILKEILKEVSSMDGAMVWRNNTGTARPLTGDYVIRYGCIGSPDILGVIKGRAIGIEVKSLKGTQRQTQINFQRAFEKAGGLYILSKTVEYVKKVLQKEGLCGMQ